MAKLEVLEREGILGDIREALGADDENDTSKDSQIEKMSNSKCIEMYSQWHLGDGGWWRSMKRIFDNISEER